MPSLDRISLEATITDFINTRVPESHQVGAKRDLLRICDRYLLVVMQEKSAALAEKITQDLLTPH